MCKGLGVEEKMDDMMVLWCGMTRVCRQGILVRNKSAAGSYCGRVVGKRSAVFDESQEHRYLVVYPCFSIYVSSMGLYSARFYVATSGNVFIAQTSAYELCDL